MWQTVTYLKRNLDLCVLLLDALAQHLEHDLDEVGWQVLQRHEVLAEPVHTVALVVCLRKAHLHDLRVHGLVGVESAAPAHDFERLLDRVPQRHLEVRDEHLCLRRDVDIET